LAQQNSTVPNVGSRVHLQVFAQDLLRHSYLVQVETYPTSGYVAATFSDGAGATIAITGDRSSVRMVLSAALAQLGPDDPEPDPPAAEEAA
jgi:hypothetical protein